MKYKMIVMDMDGTLLNDDKKISDRNKEVLEKAAELGVKVVISTGRIFTSAIVYGEMIGIKTPIIASNGAYIREKDRDEVVYAKELGIHNVREIIRISKKHGIWCHFYTPDTVYSEKLVYSSINYSKWNKGLPEDRKVKIEILKENQWEDVINEKGGELLKAVITDDDREKIAALREEMSKLDVEIASSYDNNFEVMNKGVSKGNAVAVLAEYFGIDREEIICMGDNENDISMIEYAGLGIAMANATEETQKAAKFVTLSNNEDGVAYAIEKFIL